MWINNSENWWCPCVLIIQSSAVYWTVLCLLHHLTLLFTAEKVKVWGWIRSWLCAWEGKSLAVKNSIADCVMIHTEENCSNQVLIAFLNKQELCSLDQEKIFLNFIYIAMHVTQEYSWLWYSDFSMIEKVWWECH